jgi:cellulose synthase/poly-beta-1,6-N-acetylglucosamine synthase-like glycosyltransferase
MNESSLVLTKKKLIRQDQRWILISIKASFVSIGLIPSGIDKCNTKIMIDTIRDMDLFRVEN